MSNQFLLSGNLTEKDTTNPLSGFKVTIKTTAQELDAVTDESGKFSFPIVTEPIDSPDETTFEIQLSVEPKNGFYQDPENLKLTIKKGTPEVEQNITMVNRGPISNIIGGIFLTSLLVGLLVLGYFYYNKHNENGDKSDDPVNSQLVETLTKSLLDRINNDSIMVSSFKVNKDTISNLDQSLFTTEYHQINEAANELLNASKMDNSYKSAINRNIGDIKKAIDQKNKAYIQTALSSTKKNIKGITEFLPKWFWISIPGIYYEILLWALFGTLLRLIGNTSYYVSRSIFFRNSIANKFPLIVTIPLIALLITFVISFFKISIVIGGVNFTLDFSNPYVSIILAALIGLAPWKAWKFMYGLADKLFKGLNSWLGLENSESGNN